MSPSHLESQAGCCQLPRELQKTVASADKRVKSLVVMANAFLHPFHLLVAVLRASLVFQSSAGFLSFSFWLIFLWQKWPILGQQRFIFAYVAGKSILVSWTRFSHQHVAGLSTAVQRFFFKSSKHSIINVWSPRLHWLTATHFFSMLPDLFNNFVMVII